MEGRAEVWIAPAGQPLVQVGLPSWRGNMDAKTFQTIAAGDIITYTLSADQRPTNPHRTYRGVVTSIVHKAQSVILTLLDEGYEGLSEPVASSQIQSVAKP
jgi:hypothetical protein